MGVRNYLIEGVSGTGKTTVAEELQRRGYHVVHGDRELAYVGDPKTGEALVPPLNQSTTDAVAWGNKHWIWPVYKVKALAADHHNPMSFFCGGSRNWDCFIDLFDEVFILDVDLETLNRRLAARPEDEFGGRPIERELVVRLHATEEDIPRTGVRIDATQPIARVVDAILAKCEEAGRAAG
jgi:adenylate kinase family enzyme